MNSLCPRILFCSLSAKYALFKEVERNALKFSSDASVIGCDSDSSCQSASSVEDFVVLPNLKSINDTEVLQVCKKNKITHILPTRDAELEFWAERKKGPSRKKERRTQGNNEKMRNGEQRTTLDTGNNRAEGTLTHERLSVQDLEN